MKWIIGAISVGVFISIAISAWTAKPCPREEAGWPCKKEKGQKCECEE